MKGVLFAGELSPDDLRSYTTDYGRSKWLLIEQSFTQPSALVGGRIGCRPFENEAEAAIDRDTMEWMPPLDGIAMCQGGDLRIPRMEEDIHGQS
jgi:hypothetical protein